MSRSLLFLVALLIVSPTYARPPYRQALLDLFGTDLPAKLRDCRTCHVDAKPEGDAPHNAFGARLEALRNKRTKTGKKLDIAARIVAILGEDSDRDGVSDGLELFAGHSPGDSKDKPDSAAVKLARQKLAHWHTVRDASYAWKPFEPVTRPVVPTPRQRDWVRNPIDAFLAAEHDKRDLQTRPSAPKHVLLRRVYLDLVGLPPSSDEMRAFLDDDSDNAYERVVDRLLASPRHGERWGRHWMDVWRYSDWAGYGSEVRDSQRHIWHWRDWIIDSVNGDRPYDRMIQEMLAGDELAPTDPDTLRATGFLVRNWYKFNRNVWLDRIVEHTGKAFLGVTLNCAKCHDHFYDPVSMQEYYAFRAIFEPHDVRTDRLPGQPDVQKDGLPRVYDAKPGAPTYVFARGDEARPDRTKGVAPAVPVALGGRLAIKPVQLPPLASQPDKRPFVIEESIAASEVEVAKAIEATTTARRRLAAALIPPTSPLLGIAWTVSVRNALALRDFAERDAQFARARHAQLLAQLAVERHVDAGDMKSAAAEEARLAAGRATRERDLAFYRREVTLAEYALWFAGAKLRRPALTKLANTRKELAKAEAEAKRPLPGGWGTRSIPSFPSTSTGRRLALAQWITSVENPLTARVLVNHVWLRHFGKGLVTTEFDFGKNGQPPTHPVLLDWLAAEFMDSGWSLKALHRRIVTSAAYRMDSTGDETMLARDPDNRYLWRMNPRRMEGEVVRDSLLSLAGRLDTTMGGPDLDHRTGLTSARRSVYYRHAPEKQMEFLALFDAPSVNECYHRSESVIPQQALALSNSTLSVAMSRLVAAQMARGSEDEFIRAGYERVLGREPTPRELSACREFLAEQQALLADSKNLTRFATGPISIVPASTDPAQRAREGLLHALFNLHEFVTIR